MVTKENFLEALRQIRKQEQEKEKKVKFDQTIDLIINLREFDLKKTPLSLFINFPNKIADKKIAGFLEKKSSVIDTITKVEFDNFKDKNQLKKLIKEYDFFLAGAKLMPSVAATFGRVLGPAGKMPSPQLGIVMNEKEEEIRLMVDKINSVIRIRPKEPSIKVAIGKQSSKDEDVATNCAIVYNEIFKNLPKKKENIKSVLIKFTMGKPAKVVL